MTASKLSDQSVSNIIRNIFSIRGYSHAFNTDNPFLKLLWITLISVLVVFCFITVVNSLNQYNEHNVITSVNSFKNKTLQLPALTICSIYGDLKESKLRDCKIGKFNCTFDDFEYFEVDYWYDFFPHPMKCYKINGGRNLTGHETYIHSTDNIGLINGIRLEILDDKIDQYVYFVGDSRVKPLIEEMQFFIGGSYNIIKIKKQIIDRLGEPYNPCQKNLDKIDSYESFYYKDIIRSNLTYRKRNCLDICKKKRRKEK